MRAAKEVQQHLETNPSDGPGWMQLALYQVKSGSPQAVLSLIQKAELLGAADMDSQLTKVRILENLGQREKALATLAVCFQKGATQFQIAQTPDLQTLQEDTRYQKTLEKSQRQHVSQ